MRHTKLFRIFILLFALSLSSYSAISATSSLHFLTAPTLQNLSNGSLIWKGALSCSDPGLLSGVTVVFSFDTDLDGAADGDEDSTQVSAADCDSGQAHVSRTLFPERPGIITAELRQGSALLDHSSALTNGIGTLLSIHRFCARPTSGEPEWIEINNPSSNSTSLADIRVEGHLLAGSLLPGASLLVGKDSLDLLRWQPAAAIFTTTTWSYLRNSGDTLRITWNNSTVLDSVVYGTAVDSHEGCASALTDDDVSAATGYAIDISPLHWHTSSEPLVLKVQAPAGRSWNLSAYDLDGFEICKIGQNKAGSSEIDLSASDCRGLVNRSGSVILQLRPDSSSPIRKRIRVLNP